MEKRRNNFIGPIILFITAFFWGTAFVAQKLGSDYVGPFTYNAYRFLISGVVLCVAYLIKRKVNKNKVSVEEENRIKDNKSKKWIIINCIIITISLFFGATLLQFGIKYTTPGKAGFLSSIYILVVPIIGIFFKKKTKFYTWIWILIALTGSFLISYQKGEGFDFGDILILISAIGYSFQIFFIDRVNKYIDSIFLTGIQLLGTGLLSFIVKVIVEPFDVEALGHGILAIVYAAIFSSCIAYYLQVVGQRTTPPTAASLIMSLESVFALLSGLVILHETLLLREWIGCGLIFLSILGSQFSINTRTVKNNEENG